jgi:hypothetical protein
MIACQSHSQKSGNCPTGGDKCRPATHSRCTGRPRCHAHLSNASSVQKVTRS